MAFFVSKSSTHNAAASFVGFAAFILIGSGLIASYSAWFNNRIAQQVQATTTVYDTPRPKLPRYQIPRKRNRILVTEIKPDKVPVIQTGPIALHNRIETNQPVIFITIDDGVYKDEVGGQFMANLRLPTTLFLTTHDIHDNYDYFGRLSSAGMTIENHTLSHPHLKKLTFDQQKQDICGSSDDLAAHYGRRPVLFRPPYGEYNDDTLRAASECGIKAVVLWSVVVDKGQLAYQQKEHLLPGDIVLLHFRPELMQDLQTVLRAAHEQNLSVANLEDWLP